MRVYAVMIPIAGHACVQVEAESEKEAIDKAMEEVTLQHVDDWEALKRFNQGNVCYCPSPWEIEVEDQGEADE